jgi:predicted nucleic acid-binding protein
VRIALDTNILVYMEGVNGDARRDATVEIVERLPQNSIVVPGQVLGELFNVLVRKARWSRQAALAVLLNWHDGFAVIETSQDALLAAVHLATHHRLAIWDAVALAAASQAGCRMLLSEDLQQGFTWDGTTVVNPFATPRHPLLSALLGESPAPG